MNAREKQYHIGLSREDVEGAEIALLPGDPGRVEKIAREMENPKMIGQCREYTSWLGRINGRPVLVMSTGMGGPSTAIAVEELNMLGIRIMIRVGTCGGIKTDVKAGDVIVVNGAVRQEGTSLQYIPIEYPAVADVDLVCALRDAASALGYTCHVGIAQSKDSFYGQHNPDRMPVGYELRNKWEAWKKAGVLASEMETATLFTVASIYGIKAGAILLCVWNQEREALGLGNDEIHEMTAPIKIAINAIKKLDSCL